MGVKLLIFLALVIGVLYCIHLLVKDYQAVSGSKLLRLLFKRDTQSMIKLKYHVRWKKIRRHDSLQCARAIFCHLGVQDKHDDIQKGLIFMLTLEPQEEDKNSLEEFMKAYSEGLITKKPELCHKNYSQCPFGAATLFEFVKFLVKNPLFF